MTPIKLDVPPHWRQRSRLFVEPRKAQGLIPMVSNDDYERERDEESRLTRQPRSRSA